jgi:hypothetical protein
MHRSAPTRTARQVVSQWTDASASNWGTETVSGNILAPDSAHC